MIVVYSKSNCPACNQAKNLLAIKGQSYNEINIDTPTMRETFMEQFPGVRSVPYILINGQAIGGYSELKEYFDNNTKQFLAE